METGELARYNDGTSGLIHFLSDPSGSISSPLLGVNVTTLFRTHKLERSRDQFLTRADSLTSSDLQVVTLPP